MTDSTQRQAGPVFDSEASIRRMVAAYRRGPADRIPIMSPIPWQPNGDIDSKQFGDWRDAEGFREVARMVQKHCDVRPTYSSIGYPGVWAGTSYQRFLEAPAEHIETLPVETLNNGLRRHTTLLHTPKGDLKWAYEEEPGIFTNWDMHKPIQSPDDVEKMLSVPYTFTPPDPADYEPFRKRRSEMGENATGGSGVNSMVAMLCGMMDYERLLEWILTEPTLVKMLADEWLRRVGEKVDWMLSQGVGPFWHFNGVERACPPMMSPKQWDELVVAYDGEIMRRIKAADPDAKIHVHCHAKSGTLLDSFVAMGVDSTDPVEPPPQGDTDIVKAKQAYDGRLLFFGNIQFLDMETGTPDDIEALVKRAITGGGKRNIVLMTTAGPHQRPTERFIANAKRYIEAGLKHGEL
ncbi:MAG: hypothetical protein HOJ57_39660 [Lentisphaerae bacterium]|jgi:hypothetical protein|nr:hypothetical protein [Lentisphaerota bacterium]MBT4817794.1 hypothetical protein [Lentisphaerota bacterium]MBT5612121.1 hypothetical protein [Lentisphaerota bacterium]MBT7058780.1 hypothetical protein [Lentisphaerota bacterium]